VPRAVPGTLTIARKKSSFTFELEYWTINTKNVLIFILCLFILKLLSRVCFFIRQLFIRTVTDFY